MNLSAIFRRQSCAVNLRARDKKSAIEALASLAVKSGRTGRITAKTIAAAIMEREAQGSTGFGDEIAIPHARVAGMEDFLVFIAHAPKGVDYDSLDKKKVKIFFVILGPEDEPSAHVQILAAISRSMSGTSLKKELMAAGSEEVMAESFLRHAGEKHEESPRTGTK